MDADEQIKNIFGTVKAIHQLAVEVQAAYSASQISLIAIAEQLVEADLLDGTMAADRMRKLKETPFLSKEALRAIDILAAEIESLNGPSDPKPPRGGKPTLVR